MGRQNVGALKRGRGGWAPVLPASSTPTRSAASLVCCGSGASRRPVSCGVPLSVASPLIPAPLPALPPSPGPPGVTLTAGWGPYAGRWQAGRSSPFPRAAVTCLVIACIPGPPPRRKASWEGRKLPVCHSPLSRFWDAQPPGPSDAAQRAWRVRGVWNGCRALVPCCQRCVWGSHPGQGPPPSPAWL